MSAEDDVPVQAVALVVLHALIVSRAEVLLRSQLVDDLPALAHEIAASFTAKAPQ